MTETVYLGIDHGSTKTAVSLWSRADGGRPVRVAQAAPWTSAGLMPETALPRMFECARTLLRDSRADGGGAELAAIGVSAGGPVDVETGTLLSVPNSPGWEDVPIASEFAGAFGVPVHVENDANACALAEWRYGAGRGSDHLAFLTFSTGIGAGLVLGGRLYRGARNLAGEVGHVEIVPDGLPCGCGQRGCLEAYASGAGIVQRLEAAFDENPSPPRNARELVRAAKGGDAFSIDFLAETADFLARGLAQLAFILNVDRIVLGTIAAAAGDILLEPLRASLERRVWPEFARDLEVVPSELWPDLGDISAFAVAVGD